MQTLEGTNPARPNKQGRRLEETGREGPLIEGRSPGSLPASPRGSEIVHSTYQGLSLGLVLQGYQGALPEVVGAAVALVHQYQVGVVGVGAAGLQATEVQVEALCSLGEAGPAGVQRKELPAGTGG